jgi:hypothetical protein
MLILATENMLKLFFFLKVLVTTNFLFKLKIKHNAAIFFFVFFFVLFYTMKMEIGHL